MCPLNKRHNIVALVAGTAFDEDAIIVVTTAIGAPQNCWRMS